MGGYLATGIDVTTIRDTEGHATSITCSMTSNLWAVGDVAGTGLRWMTPSEAVDVVAVAVWAVRPRRGVCERMLICP